MRSFTERLLDLLYPPKCPFCFQVIPSGRLLCKSCQKSIQPISGSVCLCCGGPVEGGQEYCRRCKNGRYFSRGIGIYPYDERLRRSVLAYKNGGQRIFAKTYVAAMAAYGSSFLKEVQPDVILGVPLHPSSQAQRGFNQAQLLARLLSRQVHIPCSDQLLWKVKKTSAQKSLGQEDRRHNLDKSFRASKKVRGLRVLVVDDVYTTGSTMDAVAKALRLAGASEVFFMTLCNVPRKQE